MTSAGFISILVAVMSLICLYSLQKVPVQFQITQDINVPLQQVFTFICDPRNIPQVNLMVKAVKILNFEQVGQIEKYLVEIHEVVDYYGDLHFNATYLCNKSDHTTQVEAYANMLVSVNNSARFMEHVNSRGETSTLVYEVFRARTVRVTSSFVYDQAYDAHKKALERTKAVLEASQSS